MKGALGLRPVFHHREDRIRGHIQLCWLALLLLRATENATGDTWRNIRHELDRMHLVTLATPAGHRPTHRHHTRPADHLRALALPEPPRFFDFTLPTAPNPTLSRSSRVVTRPQPGFSAFPQVKPQIQALVCS